MIDKARDELYRNNTGTVTYCKGFILNLGTTKRPCVYIYATLAALKYQATVLFVRSSFSFGRAISLSCRSVFFVLSCLYTVSFRNLLNKCYAESMESIQDLFGIERYTLKTGRPMDERASLIKFFLDKVNQNGHRFSPSRMGARLAHFSLDQLYALKSSWNDREGRDGYERAIKFWWWTTKTLSS